MKTAYELTKKECMALTTWYERSKRSFPWRDTNNPYDVWLSEIMLQQTRISFVLDRFVAFKQQLPTIASLANCEETVLMKLWEGMGYYSRARNLKKCAIQVMNQYNGILPDNVEDLKSLSGIGPYTAGAIASIAYGQPTAAVDGNVLRVFARRFGCEADIRNPSVRKTFEETIQTFYQTNPQLLRKHPAFPASFTQGLMELGEVLCVPNAEPKCAHCPFRSTCVAHLENKTDQIPFRSSLKARKIQKRTLFLIRDGDRFLFHKRPSTGLLAGLYEFIGVDGWLSKSEALQAIEALGLVPLRIHPQMDSKHIFSHLEWHMKAYEVQVEPFTLREDDILVNKKELTKFAVPSAFHTYIEYYSLKD